MDYPTEGCDPSYLSYLTGHDYLEDVSNFLESLQDVWPVGMSLVEQARLLRNTPSLREMPGRLGGKKEAFSGEDWLN